MYMGLSLLFVNSDTTSRCNKFEDALVCQQFPLLLPANMKFLSHLHIVMLSLSMALWSLVFPFWL
jgi:hypothetical protein